MKTPFWITLFMVALDVSFGYDGYSACPKQYRSSREEAQLPCDFKQQSWCTIPGSVYPWHAVRRFVHENHGLMRRMYGDERPISVLRAEIESNDVEIVRDPGWNVEDDVKFRYSSKPHFRPVNRSPPPLPSQPPTLGTTMPSTSPSSTTSTSTKKTVQDTTEVPGTAATPGTLNSGRVNFNLLNATRFSSTTAAPLDSTRLSFTGTPAVPPTTTDDFSTEDSDETTQDPVAATTLPIPTASSAPNASIGHSSTTSSIPVTTSSAPSSTKEEGIDRIQDNVADDMSSEESAAQETLFQDAEQQIGPGPDMAQQPGKPTTPLIKLRGVNACPVKEEVVAPFWANNTRGEVLALLNLYPFEQYVHFEKCTHEHKQMFCREGCRCEQQYRLHRLLAYDPNNECRGIFSDWFKFPSCCICRCYDLPAEFRFTSRSPRTPVLRPPQPLKVSRSVPRPPPPPPATDWYRLQTTGG